MTNAAYEARIAAMQWPDLKDLFAQIQAGPTPGWAAGKALEYLVPRMFELDNAQVRWPYSIKLHGEVVEQIDGAVVAGGLHCLLECKNEGMPLAIAPIAKMRNQLLRRPASSVGLIFSMSGYTEPALLLTGYLGGQTILLWHPQEIEMAVSRNKIIDMLEAKYRLCVQDGFHDVDSTVPGIL